MKSSAAALLFLLLATCFAHSKELRATIVYDDAATELNPASEIDGNLWITVEDLTRATRFVIKPQGVCRDELCFPLPKARREEFLSTMGDKQWFNMTAFAALVHQPVVRDEGLSIWYFGQRSDQQQRLTSLEAPDFTLPDMEGKQHSLRDFRGKKVFLVTWASW